VNRLFLTAFQELAKTYATRDCWPSPQSHSHSRTPELQRGRQHAQRFAGDERRGARAPVSWLLLITLDSASSTEEHRALQIGRQHAELLSTFSLRATILKTRSATSQGAARSTRTPRPLLLNWRHAHTPPLTNSD
jgi:hypothetical protein